MQRTDLANPPQVRVAHTGTPLISTPQPEAAQYIEAVGRNHFHRRLLLAVVALMLLIIAIPAALVAYQAAHEGRVYNGVKALGVDLGGMNRAEAAAALGRAAAGYPNTTLAVQAGSQSWTFAPGDLGLGMDIDKTAEAALQYGRSGDFMSNAGAELHALFSGAAITPSIKHDAAKVQRAVEKIAADVDKPTVDSKLTQDSGGKVTITASSTGATLDREALNSSITQALGESPLPSVPVVQARLQSQAPKITEAVLQRSQSQAMALTEQPIELSLDDQSWTLQPEDLRGMLSLPAAPDGSYSASLDSSALADFLKPVADKVRVEPTDATVVVGKGTVTLTPDKSGKALEVPAAVAAIEQAAKSQDTAGRTVTLPLKDVPAAQTAADVQPVYSKVNALVTQGIRLRYKDDGEETGYTLRGASVTGFLDVASAQGGPGPLQVVIDDEVLAGRISGVSYEINRQPTDARFRMVNGTPTKITSGQDGLRVDEKASLLATRQAIQNFSGTGKLQVDLAVADTAPTITNADMANISTPDMLSYGQTSYANSSAARATNVQLGTSNLNGALIPPGGVFSVDDTIGPLTLDAGFKMGYAIMHTDDGSLTTVPAEAGGICQVSTTLFHAVFHAGLPVVERHWHSYWIGIYGVAPTGLQGLDATIAPPDLDFRWKNSTSNWILIKATADGKNVRFELWGVNPHWTVKVAGPVITNVVPTTQDMIYEDSDALPKGQTVQVEHAQNGFDASITRTVTDSSGNVVDKWTANSHYEPAHDRTLTGTGK